MPKMFHRNEWFFELSPSALAEHEFESLLIQNAAILRPSITMLPFKKTVYAGDMSARADLAMISDDYRHWAVVEVEMSRHDLYGHVIPQIRTLREGVYEQAHAAYLASRSPTLDPEKISDMLRGNPPEVLVLVNKPDEEWRRELSRYGAHMMVFEIFRSHSNRHIFVIDGELPRPPHDVLSELSFSLLPRCLAVGSPAALDFGPEVQVPIFVEDQLTYWERFNTATGVYITPIGGMPIAPGQKYALVRTELGHYEIRSSRMRG